MSTAPTSLVVKRLREVPGTHAGALSASQRMAIVKKARLGIRLKKAPVLRREDTATGSGHVAFASKPRVA